KLVFGGEHPARSASPRVMGARPGQQRFRGQGDAEADVGAEVQLDHGRAAAGQMQMVVMAAGVERGEAVFELIAERLEGAGRPLDVSLRDEEVEVRAAAHGGFGIETLGESRALERYRLDAGRVEGEEGPGGRRGGGAGARGRDGTRRALGRDRPS